MNKKKGLALASGSCMLVFILIDQLVKWWVVTHLQTEGASIPFIPGLLNLTYLRNAGAAWGILQGQVLLFYMITCVALFGIGYLFLRELNSPQPQKLVLFAYSFILSGAIGNFIDRLHLQYVIDMFEVTFVQFPIFNVADACLTVGVVMMFIYIFFFEGKENVRKDN